jgi:hypothetical protein
MDYFNMIADAPAYITVINLKWVFNIVIVKFGLYLLWVSMHYIASHLYVHWCVPATLVGLIMSPFMVPAPHCFGLRWLIYQGGNSIMVMWSIVGVWLLSFILPIKTD